MIDYTLLLASKKIQVSVAESNSIPKDCIEQYKLAYQQQDIPDNILLYTTSYLFNQILWLNTNIIKNTVYMIYEVYGGFDPEIYTNILTLMWAYSHADISEESVEYLINVNSNNPFLDLGATIVALKCVDKSYSNYISKIKQLINKSEKLINICKDISDKWKRGDFYVAIN